MVKPLVSTENESPRIFTAKREDGKLHLTRREFFELAGMSVLACGMSACDLSNCPVVSLLASATPTLTSTPTSTSTSTPTPTPTRTPTPTSTNTPTNTPTSTFTLTPTPEIQSSTIDVASFRTGPGLAYNQIATLPAGTKFVALGLSSDTGHTWVLIRVPKSILPNVKLEGDTIDGWIPTYLSGSNIGKNLSLLPTVQSPATPTPLPGRYGNAQKGDNNSDYTYTDPYGNKYIYTVECGSPLPEGAVCTCDCVSIPLCQCDGYSAPTDTPSSSGCPSDSLTQPCNAPIPPGYVCTCNCI